MTVHVKSGYYIFADTPVGTHYEGIVTKVLRRYGKRNKSNPQPINPLVFVRTESGKQETLDQSFIVSCVHPNKVGKPYVRYIKQNNKTFEFLQTHYNPNQTQKKGILCGTAISLWYEALPGMVRDYGDLVFDNKRIVDLFEKTSVARSLYLTEPFCRDISKPFIFYISRKNLKRLIQQNINRMLKPAKLIHEEQTQQNFEIEDEFESILKDESDRMLDADMEEFNFADSIY